MKCYTLLLQIAYNFSQKPKAVLPVANEVVTLHKSTDNQKYQKNIERENNKYILIKNMVYYDRNIFLYKVYLLFERIF